MDEARGAGGCGEKILLVQRNGSVEEARGACRRSEGCWLSRGREPG